MDNHITSKNKSLKGIKVPILSRDSLFKAKLLKGGQKLDKIERYLIL